MESDSSSYPELTFLIEFAEIGKSRNRLRHWSQDRATCFITFRLGDSIPTKLLTDWRDEREEWLLTHAKPWSLEAEMEYHKRFSMRIDEWMDEGHGSCLLASPAHADRVAATLDRCNGSQYLIHSRVIMPNHVHEVLEDAIEAGDAEKVGRLVEEMEQLVMRRLGGDAGFAVLGMVRVGLSGFQPHWIRHA